MILYFCSFWQLSRISWRKWRETHWKIQNNQTNMYTWTVIEIREHSFKIVGGGNWWENGGGVSENFCGVKEGWGYLKREKNQHKTSHWTRNGQIRMERNASGLAEEIAESNYGATILGEFIEAHLTPLEDCIFFFDKVYVQENQQKQWKSNKMVKGTWRWWGYCFNVNKIGDEEASEESEAETASFTTSGSRTGNNNNKKRIDSDWRRNRFGFKI